MKRINDYRKKTLTKAAILLLFFFVVVILAASLLNVEQENALTQDVNLLAASPNGFLTLTPILNHKSTITPGPTITGSVPLMAPTIQSFTTPGGLLTKTAPLSGTHFGGRIVFRDQNPYERFNLLILDTIWGKPQLVMEHISGSPTWSPGGEFLAIGCADSSKICLLNASAMQDISSIDLSRLLAKEIHLPATCHVKEIWGVESISWSPDGKKLIVVCGDRKLSDVCILPINGEAANCWDNHDKSKSQIRRVVWSPIDNNLLAISLFDEHIYLVDSNGGSSVFLSEGVSPEWSPDGKRLVFFKWDEERKYFGIAMIDVDGANHTWLYRPPTRGSDEEAEYEKIAPTCDEISADCRLSWSPENRFIAFSSARQNPYTWYIFRIDIETGEIIFLTNPSAAYGVNSPGYAEPDWEPVQ
jgi:WD40 repeat protein